MAEYEEKTVSKVLMKNKGLVQDLIFTKEGINFFKNREKIKINKGTHLTDIDENEILCDYNKKYIEIYSNFEGYGIREFLFEKEDDTTVDYSKTLLKMEMPGSETETIIFTKKELSKIFNPKDYDNFIIFNTMPDFEYVYSKNEGVVKKKKFIIPSKEEIVKLDLSKQEGNKNMATVLGNKSYQSPEKRKYEEIDDLYIYGPAVFQSGFGHILITNREGTTNIMLFNMKYIGNGNFELKHSDIVTTKEEDEIGKYKRVTDIKVYYK